MIDVTMILDCGYYNALAMSLPKSGTGLCISRDESIFLVCTARDNLVFIGWTRISPDTHFAV